MISYLITEESVVPLDNLTEGSIMIEDLDFLELCTNKVSRREFLAQLNVKGMPVHHIGEIRKRDNNFFTKMDIDFKTFIVEDNEIIKIK